MKRKTSIIVSAVFMLAVTGFLLWVPSSQANSFFWQGTDISDSGEEGLLKYGNQRAIHDALLEALPVKVYGADDDCGYAGPGGPAVPPHLIGLPNPDCGTGDNGITGMPLGELKGGYGVDGVRIHDPSKAWAGYTLLNAFSAPDGHGPTILIDMDGAIVNSWGAAGAGFRGAAKMLQHGFVISSEGGDLVQRDWCDNEFKRFGFDEVGVELNNHHDHEREGNPVGYAAPGQYADPYGGKTLSLGALDVGPEDADPEVVEDVTHIVNVKRFDSDRPDRAITDDVIREIAWDGTIKFEWHARHHFHSPTSACLGHGLFDDEAARYALDLGLNSGSGRNSWDNCCDFTTREDWTHSNDAAWVGENRWFSKYGDWRFHPDNIVTDFRSLNTVIIIARHPHPDGDWEAGDIVWRLGPHYGTDGEDGKVGQIIGPHMAHIIPKFLPGAGNMLILDNGGGGGYGALIEGLTDPDSGEKLGTAFNKYRGFTRVLEINPMTKDIVWQYVQAKPTAGSEIGNDHKFYSNIMSGMQRLENGNTLITEADTGRIFEVTVDKEVVWEYAPPWAEGIGGFAGSVYRAYRVPYRYVPRHFLRDRDKDGTYDVCK